MLYASATEVDANEAYWAVELDLEPFKAHFPMMTRPSSIGDGVRFLNRHGPIGHDFLHDIQVLLIHILSALTGSLLGG